MKGIQAVTRDVKKKPWPDADRRKLVALARGAYRVASWSFAALVFLLLSTPSWRYGPFSWLPLARFPTIAGAPVSLGIFNLLPVLLVAACLARRLAARLAQQRLGWRWGRPAVTLSLLAITVLGLISLDPGFPRIIFIQVGGLAIFWLLYLFILNERPNVIVPLAAAVLVQGGVAFGQYLAQSDLGLSFWGELPLNPAHFGVSVLFVGGQRWLRGYGLTAHPNMLGAIITTVLLLCLPVAGRAKGYRRALLALVYAGGVIGLFASFSRSATLAFAAGLVVWLLLDRRPGLRDWSWPALGRLLRSPVALLGAGLLIIFVWLFADLALTRIINLDSPLESVSIGQRLEDGRLALDIIGRHPRLGVGLGQYWNVARSMRSGAAVVHNVPLLMAAELGLVALLPLFWLGVSGLRSRPPALALWLAVLIVGLLDNTLWLTSSWQTAVLFAFAAANLSQDITSPAQAGEGVQTP